MLNVDEQERDYTSPCESYVCFGRDLKDACEMFIEKWTQLEETGRPIDLYAVDGACEKLREALFGMRRTYKKYLNGFEFSPSPLSHWEDAITEDEIPGGEKDGQ